MIDLKEYLALRRQMSDSDEETTAPGRVVPSRNQLLSQSRGSIRQHLQQQLVSALEKFYSEVTPATPDQIV